MTKRRPPPTWFVLEYLSAESWVDGAHGLPSPHPRLPLKRTFWFPGFTPASGGLLRERGLIDARHAFRADAAAMNAFWSSLALPAPVAGERRISLFCYPNPALPTLLDAWADGGAPVTCVVPEGVATSEIDALDRRRRTACRAPRRARPPRAARNPVPRRRTPTIACCGLAMSISFAARIRSCARNGRRSLSSGSSTRRPTTRTGRSSTPSSIATRSERMPNAGAAVRQRAFWTRGTTPAVSTTVADAWHSASRVRPAALARHGHRWADELAALPDLAAGLVKSACDNRGIIEGFPKSTFTPSARICASPMQATRHENRPGSTRRQRDHGRQGPDGRAEGRVHEIRPQRVGRQDEAEEPAVRQRARRPSTAPTRSSTSSSSSARK